MGWNYCCANTQYCLFLTLTSSSPREYTGFWFETLHKRFAHLLPSLWQSLAPTFQRAGHGAWGWCFTQTPHLHLQRSERNTSGYGHTHLSHWVCVQWNPKVFPPVVIFWGLKGCNSIIRFSDPGATVCLIGLELN